MPAASMTAQPQVIQSARAWAVPPPGLIGPCSSVEPTTGANAPALKRPRPSRARPEQLDMRAVPDHTSASGPSRPDLVAMLASRCARIAWASGHVSRPAVATPWPRLQHMFGDISLPDTPLEVISLFLTRGGKQKKKKLVKAKQWPTSTSQYRRAVSPPPTRRPPRPANPRGVTTPSTQPKYPCRAGQRARHRAVLCSPSGTRARPRQPRLHVQRLRQVPDSRLYVA